jgi:hypothetical protein
MNFPDSEPGCHGEKLVIITWPMAYVLILVRHMFPFWSRRLTHAQNCSCKGSSSQYQTVTYLSSWFTYYKISPKAPNKHSTLVTATFQMAALKCITHKIRLLLPPEKTWSTRDPKCDINPSRKSKISCECIKSSLQFFNQM